MRACLGGCDKSRGGGEAMTLRFLKAAGVRGELRLDVRETQLRTTPNKTKKKKKKEGSI